MFNYNDLSAFPSSPVTRFELNKQAILIAKRLGESEASDNERRILAQYSGWGDTQVRKRGFDWAGDPIDPELAEVLTKEETRAIAKSALNAHYTGLDVVRSMWQMAELVMGGNVSSSRPWILEPSCGSGVFFGTLPQSLYHSRLVGIELDPLTALITQKLYPEADIKACGLEQANLPLGSFDLIIGNVPFGNYAVNDPSLKFSFLKASIHDYFIAKSVTLLKPNGHAILITSRYTLDKQDSSVREWISKHAELVLAVRLPETAFQQSAGTDVVTDILVLRKRPQPVTKPEDWVATVEKEGDGGRANVSVYYDLHPEHLLGTYCRGKMQAGFSISVKPRAEGSLAEHLGIAMASLSPPIALAPIPANPIPTPVLNEACALARRVFDRAKELLQAQTNGKDTALPRRRLNAAYDGYKTRFGTFASASQSKQAHVLSAVQGEGWFAFLQALEDKQGNKAKLFAADTVTSAYRSAGALKLGDAIHVCLDQMGKLDVGELERLTGLSTELVVDGLVSDNLAYLDPSSHTWLPSTEYLSGNVRAKLQLAKDAAGLDSQFERNVSALTQAQPEPLGPSEIKVSFGAGWIPADIYVGFLRSIFPGTTWGIKVNRIEPTATWIVDVSNPYVFGTAENRDIYGTPRMTAIEIIQEAINLKILVIYDEIEDADGNTVRVKNQQETAAVQGKLLEIRARWDSWLFADEARAAEVCAIYNAKFNGFRLRQYSGDYLTFPGLALEVDGKPYQLRRHQRSGVARILSQSEYDNSAFPVYPPGYGKTDTAVCGVVKAVQLGLVSKVCIVVPKHTLGQWRERFLKLYPGLADELLAATDDSFNSQNRKRFLSSIASGGYRYVILTFEQFRTIPLSAEMFNKYLGAELEELRDYLNDTVAKSTEAKALQKEFKKREKALAKFEAKYKARWEALTKEGEAPVTWEECGFNGLVWDEIQALKRDIVMSKMENIAGLPRGESQRAFDARVKAHYVLSHKGKVIGLTGTPLTNTLAEAYVWLRFCQPRLLRHLGLWHFDSWASTFAEPFTSVEMDSVGQFRQQTRLRFQNIPELLTILAECWDRAPEAPEVKKPEIVGGQMRVVEVAGSEGLIEYTKSLADRADKVRARKVDPTEDNMLVITSDGRKASLFNGDPELGFVDGIRTKVDALVDEVWKYYKESYAELGTQIVFCDLYTPKAVEAEEVEQHDIMTEGERFSAFGVYGVIKDKLVAKGMLAGEIEFAHDAKNDAERLAQHDRMNRGRCRVIIGSTGKMGTGVNVQDVVYAVHHLDCPWRPDELEQRTARGVRDGNKWPAVHVLCYVTQRSYDPVVWQLVEYKARLVAQIMSGKLTSRQTDDIGTLVLTAGMAKAIALGDGRVVEKIRLEMELAGLERQWKAWHNTRIQMKYEARKIPEMVEQSRAEIDEHWKAVEILGRATGFDCRLREVGGDRLVPMGSAQEASEHVRKLANLLGRTIRTRAVAIGELNGLGLYLENWHGTLTMVGRVAGGSGGYRVQGLTYQNARSLEQMLAEFSHATATVRRLEAGIKVQESRLRTAETELGKEWGGAGRARELLDKYRLLCQDLTQGGMVDEQEFRFG